MRTGGTFAPSTTKGRTVSQSGHVPEPAVLSLDVFDTALIRACGDPQTLFLMLGNRLARAGTIGVTPEVFARVRARAEADVWHREGGLDAQVLLEDFYDEVVRRLQLDPVVASEFVREELALEAQLLRGNPRVAELIERQRVRGGRVAFLSDTYFRRGFVTEQLREAGLLGPDDLVVVSSEHHGSKSHGQLFDVALDALGVAPSEVVHAGDNPHSDGTAARDKHMRVLPLPGGQLTRFEALFSEHAWETGGLGAAFAGASRLARLDTPASSRHLAAIRDVSAGVAAPMLVAYVLWLLQRAQAHSLDRMYFIARDGQVMAEVASILVRRLDLDIEVAYLYANRASVNLAAMDELGEEDLAWVERDLPELTPGGVLRHLGIEGDRATTILKRLGVAPEGSAGSAAARRTFEAVTQDPELGALVLERAAERRELAVSYLEQERLLDGSSCGLVDFGGVGSQLRALHLLVTGGGGKAPRMFLVGLDRLEDAGLRPIAGSRAWLEDTECWLYDHRRRRGIKRRRGFGTCVQLFCSADHGTLTGYVRVGDRVEPRLAVERDDGLVDWGLPTMRAAITSFAGHLAVDADLVELHADLREPVTSAIDLLWTEPSIEEAAAFGAVPFEGAQVDSGSQRPRLAQPYAPAVVVRGLLDRSFPDLGWRHWHEGSLRLSSSPVRAQVRGMELAYRRVERMRHPLGLRVTQLIRRILGRAPRP